MPQSDQTGEKIGQIVGVMVNVPGLQGLWRDVDGFHAHVVRRREVARIILEHGGARRRQPDRVPGGRLQLMLSV